MSRENCSGLSLAWGQRPFLPMNKSSAYAIIRKFNVLHKANFVLQWMAEKLSRRFGTGIVEHRAFHPYPIVLAL
jgi:hypothetical protein